MDRSAFEARPFSIVTLIRAVLPHSHTPLSGSLKMLLRLVPFDLFHIFNSFTFQDLYFTVSFLGVSAKNFRKTTVCFVTALWRPEGNFAFFYLTLIFNTFARKFLTGFVHFLNETESNLVFCHR